MNQEPTKKYHFAVFGDIHGRIALMYTVALLWQKETGRQLAGLIQVGDMGAYPNPLMIDNATKAYSKQDSDELGFSNFCKFTPEAKTFLDNIYSPCTYFIRGNHEDFNFLSHFKDPAAVDPWNKIYYIPDGKFIKLKLSNLRNLTIGAFGGIPPATETKMRGKNSKEKYKKSKLKSLTDPRFFNEDFSKQVFIQPDRLDILVTHAGPQFRQLKEGSTLITKLAERIQPKIHVFGHHHKIIGPTMGPGGSLTIGLEHFKFKSTHQPLVDGSWGILTLEDNSVDFTFPSPNDYQFLNLINRSNYKKLANSIQFHP